MGEVMNVGKTRGFLYWLVSYKDTKDAVKTAETQPQDAKKTNKKKVAIGCGVHSTSLTSA